MNSGDLLSPEQSVQPVRPWVGRGFFHTWLGLLRHLRPSVGWDEWSKTCLWQLMSAVDTLNCILSPPEASVELNTEHIRREKLEKVNRSKLPKNSKHIFLSQSLLLPQILLLSVLGLVFHQLNLGILDSTEKTEL